MGKAMKVVGAVAGVLLLTACKSAIVGDWQSADPFCTDQSHDQITINDDLTGTGSIALACDAKTGSAVVCPANMIATERTGRKGAWELAADFGYCDAAKRDVGELYKECTLQSDDTQLRCCDPNGGDCFTYVQQ